MNSCVNSPEDGPVGPKHVEIRRYMNKIEIVTSVGFLFHMLKRCTVQKGQNLSKAKFMRVLFHNAGLYRTNTNLNLSRRIASEVLGAIEIHITVYF